MATMEQVQEAKKEFARWLKSRTNADVNGYGIGLGSKKGDCVLKVLATGKGRKALPSHIAGVPIVTEDVGIIRAQATVTLPAE